MKFGYMMQLQMPRPWTETTEREAYWNALEQAVKADTLFSENLVAEEWGSST